MIGEMKIRPENGTEAYLELVTLFQVYFQNPNENNGFEVLKNPQNGYALVNFSDEETEKFVKDCMAKLGVVPDSEDDDDYRRLLVFYSDFNESGHKPDRELDFSNKDKYLWKDWLSLMDRMLGMFTDPTDQYVIKSFFAGYTKENKEQFLGLLNGADKGDLKEDVDDMFGSDGLNWMNIRAL